MKTIRRVSGLFLLVACGSATSPTPPPPPPPPPPPNAVASVMVTATSTTIAINDLLTLVATVKDAQGNTLTGHAVTWTSSAPAVATVSASGVVTAIAAGSATIHATSDGVTGSLAITVTGGPVNLLLGQRVLAQEGLAVALVSSVLQSQSAVMSTAQSSPAFGCQPWSYGTSVKKQSGDATTTPPFDVAVYYDSTCSRPYLVEHVTAYTVNVQDYHMVATASYFGPTGTALGATAYDLSLRATVDTNGVPHELMYGLGSFTPQNGAPSVSLGLNCYVALVFTGSFTVPCQAGVAQNFPALSTAIGAIISVNLALRDTAVTFTGSSLLKTGPLNSLTLSNPQPTSLALAGGATYGTSTSSGGEATFSLFPPMPTGWTIIDAGHDQQFTINLVSNSVRNLTGSITRISSGSVLATIAVDQSGTGTIAYSDGTHAAVTAWTLEK